ncbi:RidA family protein [Microbacterium sp. ARD32]|uniref:RidA family protein n=1 Tax=Microbacterium sp. ARD32 TaxID=2962577 RepID=UPI0028815B0A|nr:RidA family protein [Microbacterium sp. ARD32]MDT0156447.1 RidA family protein [Microbacterium sp. ARD32]
MIEPMMIEGHGPVVVVGGPAGLVFLSGIGPAHAADADPAAAIELQVEQTAGRLEEVLAERDLAWTNVAKVIVYLTDNSELDAVMSGLRLRFGSTWSPAVTFVQVDNLPVRGVRVQLDVVAAA